MEPGYADAGTLGVKVSREPIRGSLSQLRDEVQKLRSLVEDLRQRMDNSPSANPIGTLLARDQPHPPMPIEETIAVINKKIGRAHV